MAENNQNNNQNFEEIVNDIIISRYNIIIDNIYNNINTSITSKIIKILSIEGINNSTLISTFGISLTGLYYISNIIQDNKIFKTYFNVLIGNFITIILSIITIGTGTTICIRHRNYLNLILLSYNHFQKIIEKYLNKISIIVIISITLVSSLAIKLKVKFIHLKWIYKIILIKLLESIRLIEKNIDITLKRLIEQ